MSPSSLSCLVSGHCPFSHCVSGNHCQRRYFRRRIGGITGDCLGAANQCVEVAVSSYIELPHGRLSPSAPLSRSPRCAASDTAGGVQDSATCRCRLPGAEAIVRMVARLAPWPDRIVSSDLGRAAASAEIALPALGSSGGPRCAPSRNELRRVGRLIVE